MEFRPIHYHQKKFAILRLRFPNKRNRAPAIGSVARPGGIATHSSPQNSQRRESTALSKLAKSFSCMGFRFSAQRDFGRVVIPEISASYIDGVFQISESASRPSAPFYGHLESRPILRPEITNSKHRRRFKISEIVSRPIVRFQVKGISTESLFPNKCVVRRRRFPNKRNRVSPIGSACHPGEIAPHPHPEITNEKHRLRCPNN